MVLSTPVAPPATSPIQVSQAKQLPKKVPSLVVAYQYRIYPTPRQAILLGHVLNTHCNLYNDALRLRTEAYKQTAKSLTYMDQQTMIPDRIRSGGVATGRESMAYTLRRLDAAMSGFVKRVVKWRKSGSPKDVELGYPDFVDLSDFKSVTWGASSGAKWLPERKRLRLRPTEIGEINAVIHRPHQGLIKTITVTHRNRRWFATLTCDLGAVPQHRAGRMIGVDLGVSRLAATDDGHFVENPRFFEASSKRLKLAQNVQQRRRVTPVPHRPEMDPATGEKWPSRYSNNYRDAKVAVANIQRDTANRRKDYVNKAVLGLLETRDGFPDPVGILVLEDLMVKQMITATNKKMAKQEQARKDALTNGLPVPMPETTDGKRPRRGMAKALHDVAMGGVRLALIRKAASLGVRVILVNPANTSQRCSACGDLPAVKKTLDVRKHECAACGYTADRDTNAARNILALGQEVLRREEADRRKVEAAQFKIQPALIRKHARELAERVTDLTSVHEPANLDIMNGTHDTP